MAYIPPWQRVCDCRCLAHHHLPRTTYNQRDCACAITCATQPTTLLAVPWRCALFLDQNRDLWHVPAMATGTWDWANATHITNRPEISDASRILEHLLRQATHVLGNAVD